MINSCLRIQSFTLDLEMQKSLIPHSQFFTSLKHLEKRLKLENHQSAAAVAAPPPPPPQEVINETDSLGTPIYLCDQSATINTNIQESGPPQEFLPTNHDEAQVEGRAYGPERLDLGDDIGVLMQLLGLAEMDEKEGVDEYDEEFYERIVGMKGPKNVKEMKRLEGWIKHLLKGKGEERKEPFRMVHLLLGKAAFMHSDDGFGFGRLVYPSTINHFLQLDPPPLPPWND